VKRVQRHLGSRLANRLRCKNTAHFAWVCHRSIKALFNLVDESHKRIPVQTMLHEHHFTCERGTEQNLKKNCCIVLCLAGQRVLPIHNYEAINEIIYGLHNVRGCKVGHLVHVQTICSLHIPDHTLEIYGKYELFICSHDSTGLALIHNITQKCLVPLNLIRLVTQSLHNCGLLLDLLNNARKHVWLAAE